MNKKLYLVATPIGNYDDITIRALNVLNSADLIICEEYKEAKRLLSHYKIEKELISLNEHNENESAGEVILKIKSGKNAALISDCGTPLFSDPGHYLIQLCLSNNIDIVPIPGANSLLPALTGSGFPIENFFYYGWLSPKKERRRRELLKLKNLKEVIVILDTPYRLKTVLADIVKYLGAKKNIVVAFQLTMENEKFFRGTAKEILEIAVKKNLKGEYVIIINNLG